MNVRTLLSILLVGLMGVLLTPAVSAQDGESYDSMLDRLTNTVSLGGYFETEYVDREGSNSEFDQHRTILFFGTQPHERIRMFSELEIEHGGFGNTKLEQAWLEFALTENLNWRNGIDLIPVGRMNINHDGNLRDFVLRPEVDKRLIPSTWFEAGTGLNGSVPGAENLDFVLGVSNGLQPSDPDGSADFSTADGVYNEIRNMRNSVSNMTEDDNNNSRAYWGRLAWSPFLGTEFGLSGYNADYDPGGDAGISMAALDWYVPHGAWEFKGEYVFIEKDPEADADTDEGLEEADGGYMEVAYHFFPDGFRDSWIASGFDNPTFTLLGRFETLNFDVSPNNTNDVNPDTNITSLGFNYRPLERSAVKVAWDRFEFDDSRESENRFTAGVVLGF